MTSDSVTTQVDVPRLFIAGVESSAGVSLVSFGIVAALRANGLGVAASKVGSSLVEPTHFRRISGRLSHTIDPLLLSPKQICESIVRLSVGSELVIIESQYPLFDLRRQDSPVDTDAELSELLKAPVILVLDASKSQESLAALVKGCVTFRSTTQVLGVIANRVSDLNQSNKIAKVIESLGGVVYLGAIPDSPHIEDRSMEVTPSMLTRNRAVALRDLIRENLDIEALEKISYAARPLNASMPNSEGFSERVNVAVADDAAFHLTIQDNLDLIRRNGGELVPFSPLVDRKLPEGCKHVYLPGGYVDLYAKDLSENESLSQSIRALVAEGGVIYAESDAVAYLSRAVRTKNDSIIPQVGLFSAEATEVKQGERKAEAAYFSAFCRGESVLGPSRLSFRGFSSFAWKVRGEDMGNSGFELEGSSSSVSALGQSIYGKGGQVLAVPFFVHWGSCPEIARSFNSAYRGPSGESAALNKKS